MFESHETIKSLDQSNQKINIKYHFHFFIYLMLTDKLTRFDTHMNVSESVSKHVRISSNQFQFS